MMLPSSPKRPNLFLRIPLVLCGVGIFFLIAQYSRPSEEQVAHMRLQKSVKLFTERKGVAVDRTNRWAQDENAAALGELIFHDARFSSNGEVSCATCHDPARAFTDGAKVAVGVGTGTRNTPTVLGAARQRWQTWDGRADTLWSQAAEPMEAGVEMNFDRVSAVQLVRNDPTLLAAYEAAFGEMPLGLPPVEFAERARPLRLDAAADDLSAAWDALVPSRREAMDAVFSRIVKSLGAFQRTLDAKPSRFDHYAKAIVDRDIEGAKSLSESEARGWIVFHEVAKCDQCHSGTEFTDGEFHNLGLPGADGRLPDDRGRHGAIPKLKVDPFSSAGLFSDDVDGKQATLVRGLKSDPETWGQMRTPSLRNVGRTAPYMHDGRFASLEDVIQFYDTLEGAIALDHHREAVLRPLGLSATQKADLIAFLRSLDSVEPIAAK
ncbi:MAG: cytochrome-c peroxidase [Phycisphaerales bacterium]|nr:cytochrome-c peroxidase [Phycisphaerales bacterium]